MRGIFTLILSMTLFTPSCDIKEATIINVMRTMKIDRSVPLEEIHRLSRQLKAVLRSSGNACHDNGKRAEYASISRRNGADSRLSERRRGRKHASQLYEEIKAYQRDATLSSDEDDCLQSSDQCSIKEDSMSAEDKLD